MRRFFVAVLVTALVVGLAVPPALAVDWSFYSKKSKKSSSSNVGTVGVPLDPSNPRYGPFGTAGIVSPSPHAQYGMGIGGAGLWWATGRPEAALLGLFVGGLVGHRLDEVKAGRGFEIATWEYDSQSGKWVYRVTGRQERPATITPPGPPDP